MADFRTSRQTIEEVAAILGKFVPGEALGAVEYNAIDGCIDQVLSEIENIVAISDREEIPLRYFETVARLIAVHAASKFSNAPPDMAAIAQHEARLRYLSAKTTTYEPLKASYF